MAARTRTRTATVAAAMAILAVLASTGGLRTASAAPTPTQQHWGGAGTCTTSSTGYCTATWPAAAGIPTGTIPQAVTVTPTTAAIASVDQVTATGYRVRFAKAISSTGAVTAWATTPFAWSVSADWVEAPPPTPTPTPTATTPTPTPTTPPPTPTTTTPAACAYPTCFPDASNTGVPAGTTLTPVTGDLTVTTGQTITGKDIAGIIRFAAGATGVTITNTKARGLAGCSGCTGTVTDSTFDAQTSSGSLSAVISQGGANLTLTRVNVSNAGDLLRLSGGDLTLTDSLLSRTYWATGDHADAIQFYSPGSGGTVKLIHNSVDVRPYNTTTELGNAAIFLADNPSGLAVEMAQSRWAGGGYTVRLHDALAGSGNVYDFHDDVIVAGSYSFGPSNCSNSIPFNGSAGVKWTNVTLTDGTPLPTC